jgi:muconolactone D-isomerase
MLFHVMMTVRIPPEADPGKIGSLSAQEHERAAELQHAGKWLHLWRVAGLFANISIFRVDSADELHAILESLPLRPYMKTEVRTLCRHPGSLSETI